MFVRDVIGQVTKLTTALRLTASTSLYLSVYSLIETNSVHNIPRLLIGDIDLFCRLHGILNLDISLVTSFYCSCLIGN